MEVYYEACYNYDDDYLEHYGIKGMKWGVRRTPEQLGHHIDKQKRKLAKNVAAAKKAKAAGDKEKLKKLNIKTLKLKKDISDSKKELDKMNKEEKKKTEEERSNFLKTASAEQLYSRRHEFSESQLNTAMKRINMEQSIKSLANKETQDKIDSGRQKLESIMNFAKTASKAADTFDDVANAVNRLAGKEVIKTTKERLEEAKDPGKKERQKIIRSGDYNKIMENRDKLSDEEFNQAMTRINKSGEALKNQSQGRQTAISAHREAVKAAREIDSERESEHNQRRSEREAQRQPHQQSYNTAHQGKINTANELREHETQTEMHRVRLRENQDKVNRLQQLVDNNNDNMTHIRNQIRLERHAIQTQTALNDNTYGTANQTRVRGTQVRPITQEERALYTQMQQQNQVARQRIQQLQQQITESQNYVNSSAERTRQLKNQMKAYERTERESQRLLNELPQISEYDRSSTNNFINSIHDELLRDIA